MMTPSAPLIQLIASLCLNLASSISVVESAPSAADIGICELFKDGKFATIDCMSGPNSFCCIDKAVSLSNNMMKWSKKCCTEAEYVEENWHLFMSLIVFTMFIISLVIVIILASFGSIILTEKAALE